MMIPDLVQCDFQAPTDQLTTFTSAYCTSHTPASNTQVLTNWLTYCLSPISSSFALILFMTLPVSPLKMYSEPQLTTNEDANCVPTNI